MSTTDEFSSENVQIDDAVDSNKIPFTLINTNARSLCSKIDSLIDCFTQMDACMGVITETWLTDGEGLEEEIEDLTMGTCLNMAYVIVHRWGVGGSNLGQTQS